MTDSIDREIAAIKTVLAALEPLDAGVRGNVLDYVLKRLGIATTPPGADASPAGLQSTSVSPPAVGPVHIKTFKEQKNPRSANEMAAVAAYYLANLAPDTERKRTVSANHLKAVQSALADLREEAKTDLRRL